MLGADGVLGSGPYALRWIGNANQVTPAADCTITGAQTVDGVTTASLTVTGDTPIVNVTPPIGAFSMMMPGTRLGDVVNPQAVAFYADLNFIRWMRGAAAEAAPIQPGEYRVVRTGRLETAEWRPGSSPNPVDDAAARYYAPRLIGDDPWERVLKNFPRRGACIARSPSMPIA